MDDESRLSDLLSIYEVVKDASEKAQVVGMDVNPLLGFLDKLEARIGRAFVRQALPTAPDAPPTKPLRKP